MEENEFYKIEKFDNVDFITIKACDLTYTFCSYGASLYSLYDGENPLNLVLEDKELFLKNTQYFGKTLGLVAGRLKTNFNIGDKEFKLVNNGNDLCLHGGNAKSLSFKNWKYEVKDSKNKITVKFSISPRKGDQGFDGKVRINVTYSLSKTENSFKILFKANVSQDSLLNLSNHIYWNLSKDLTIDNYRLKFDAPEIGELDDRLLIVGTTKTPDYLNFKKKTMLKSRLDAADKTSIGTIDNTFLFNKDEGKKHKVTLENKNYKLTLKTDYPAMNIYADSSLTDVKFLNNKDLKARRGIALEPQLFDFDLDSIYFKKGDKYRHYIKYTIVRM